MPLFLPKLLDSAALHGGGTTQSVVTSHPTPCTYGLVRPQTTVPHVHVGCSSHQRPGDPFCEHSVTFPSRRTAQIFPTPPHTHTHTHLAFYSIAFRFSACTTTTSAIYTRYNSNVDHLNTCVLSKTSFTILL